MDETKNECRGCRMCYKKTLKCSIDMVPYISETEQCPCMICLVKGMCNSVCADFLKHSSASFKHQGEKVVVNYDDVSMQRSLMVGGEKIGK